MDKKITRRAVLGAIISGLAVGPFVIRSLRRDNGMWADYEKERQEYLAHLSFPREYKSKVHPRLGQEDIDMAVQIHKRYWSNYAKLHKAEFDYYSQTYLPGGVKRKSLWDMNVSIKMEYEQGFEAKGEDSNGREIDFACMPDGTLIRATPENAGFASLMSSFFGAYLAYPDVLAGYSEVRRCVEMMPNPYIEGKGLYDVLIVHDRPKDSPEAMIKQDYYSCETGMCELRYVYIAPGFTIGRGFYEGVPGTEAEVFTIYKYELVNSVYLPSEIRSVIPQTGYRKEERYSNFTHVELRQNS